MPSTSTPPSTLPPQRIIYTRFAKKAVGVSIGKSLVRRRWERKGILRSRRTLRIELWKRPILQCQLDPSNQSPFFFFFLDDGVRMVRTIMCEKGRNNRFVCFRWVSTSPCVCLIFNRMEWANEGENKNWLDSWSVNFVSFTLSGYFYNEIYIYIFVKIILFSFLRFL